MQVKDLKALLDKLPDDMQVFTADYRQIIPASDQVMFASFEICLIPDTDAPVLVIGDGEFTSDYGIPLHKYTGELPKGRED